MLNPQTSRFGMRTVYWNFRSFGGHYQWMKVYGKSVVNFLTHWSCFMRLFVEVWPLIIENIYILDLYMVLNFFQVCR